MDEFFREQLSLRHLTILPMFPGDTYAQAEEQIARFAEEVKPLLDLAPIAAD